MFVPYSDEAHEICFSLHIDNMAIGTLNLLWSKISWYLPMKNKNEIGHIWTQIIFIISESSFSAATTSKGTPTNKTVTNTIVPTTTVTTTATTDVVDDNIMMEPSRDVIHNLSDVVIDRGAGKTVHHIYSAYYDSRTNLAHRPAIVLLGYVAHRRQDKIYCKAIYEDNSTGCIGNMVYSPLIASNVWPEMYFCKIKSHDKIPRHVVISESGTCDKMVCTLVPVWNRDKAPVRDTIGICVYTRCCVYQ